MTNPIATERCVSDVPRLVSVAVKAANSNSIDGVERCFDVLRRLKSLNLSIEDLMNHSRAIFVLQSLRDSENPKILMGVKVLLNSWMKTLYFNGRDHPPSSTCDEAIPPNLKKPAFVTKYNDIAVETKKTTDVLGLKKNGDARSQAHKTGQVKKVDDCKSFVPKTKSLSLKSVRDNTCKSSQTRSCLQTTKIDAVQKKQDQISLNRETGECKSFVEKFIQAKKQYALPMKLSENPKSVAREVRILKKPGQVYKSVSTTSRSLQMKKQQSLKDSGNPKHCPALKKKNCTEMLELFEIAKKSADVANAKGLLFSKAETSLCLDTLSLLISFPISSTATETRRIMERLERLTKHKDRKICNSASALLHHWSQSIRDQQRQDSNAKTRKETI